MTVVLGVSAGTRPPGFLRSQSDGRHTRAVRVRLHRASTVHSFEIRNSEPIGSDHFVQVSFFRQNDTFPSVA